MIIKITSMNYQLLKFDMKMLQITGQRREGGNAAKKRSLYSANPFCTEGINLTQPNRMPDSRTSNVFLTARPFVVHQRRVAASRGRFSPPLPLKSGAGWEGNSSGGGALSESSGSGEMGRGEAAAGRSRSGPRPTCSPAPPPAAAASPLCPWTTTMSRSQRRRHLWPQLSLSALDR